MSIKKGMRISGKYLPAKCDTFILKGQEKENKYMNKLNTIL